MQISKKQNELVEAVKSRKYNKIFLIGALGTSKTYAMALVHCQVAYQYPGSFIPIGRNTMAESRIGTMLSYLEVLDAMGMVAGEDYTYTSGIELKIVFSNGSMILFVAIDKTKDRNWQKIKSINATCAGVDEVDGVDRYGFIMLASRTGRKNSMGAPAVTIATCNPNDAWVKEQVYDKWKVGTLNEDTLVIEFEMTDSFLYSEGYYDKFESNPRQWKERYLYNNWNYIDDENSLFRYKVLDNIEVDEFDNTAIGYCGLDVAREGKDRSVMSYIIGDVIADIRIYTRDDLLRLCAPDQRDNPPYSEILGREYIKYCESKDVGYEHAAADAVGNGAGVIDYCRGQRFNILEYKAGAKATMGDFDMLRSQMYVSIANDMQQRKLMIYSALPHKALLKRELLLHNSDITAKVQKVESKESIRKRLGMSPDVSDSITIAYYPKVAKPTGVTQFAFA